MSVITSFEKNFSPAYIVKLLAEDNADDFLKFIDSLLKSEPFEPKLHSKEDMRQSFLFSILDHAMYDISVIKGWHENNKIFEVPMRFVEVKCDLITAMLFYNANKCFDVLVNYGDLGLLTRPHFYKDEAIVFRPIRIRLKNEDRFVADMPLGVLVGMPAEESVKWLKIGGVEFKNALFFGRDGDRDFVFDFLKDVANCGASESEILIALVDANWISIDAADSILKEHQRLYRDGMILYGDLFRSDTMPILEKKKLAELVLSDAIETSSSKAVAL